MGSKFSEMRLFILVFFLFNLFISSYYIDVWQNSNSTSRALPIIAWFEEGTFKIDKYQEITVDKAYVNGHYYTDKAPLPTYVVIPFFGVIKSLGIIQTDADGSLFGKHVYVIGGLLVGSLPFVVFILIIFLEIKKLNPPLGPVLLSMLPLYFSFFYIFSGTFFAHLFAGILLLGGYIFLIKEKFLLAGFLSGLAFISEYNLAVIIFLWGIMILIRTRKFKPFVRFSIGVLPALQFMLYYNYLFSSSPFEFLYKHHNFTEINKNYGFLLPGFESIWGLALSFYRGIFWYVPVLFLVAGLAIVNWKHLNWKKAIVSYIFIPGLIYYVFIASYFAWWGGWTYGPRLLFGLAFLLIYEGIVFLSKQNFHPAFFWLFMVLGLIWIFPAKATIVYSAPTGVYNPFIKLVLPAFLSGNLNNNNLAGILFGGHAVVSFTVFMIVFILGTILLNIWYKRIIAK
ncbi:MAG: hypothetical protein R2750_00890 [Bacteroidales bacterium]